MPLALDDDHGPLVVGRAVRAHMHAIGLTVRVVPAAVMRVVGMYWDGPDGVDGADGAQRLAAAVAAAGMDTPQHRRLAFARDVQAVLRSIHNAGICRAPVLDTFSSGVFSNDVHDDTELLLGMHYSSGGGRNFSYRVAAVVAWATADARDYISLEEIEDARGLAGHGARPAAPIVGADKVETTLFLRAQDDDAAPQFRRRHAMPDNVRDLQLNRQVRANEVAEIDLVCAANNDTPVLARVQGSGRAMLAHALLRISQRKVRGQRRFKAVITYVAKDSEQRAPLRSALLALGFERADTWWTYQGEGRGRGRGRGRGQGGRGPAGPAAVASSMITGREYYVLRDRDGVEWARRFVSGIDWDGTAISTLCPLRPRSGRSLCV